MVAVEDTAVVEEAAGESLPHPTIISSPVINNSAVMETSFIPCRPGPPFCIIPPQIASHLKRPGVHPAGGHDNVSLDVRQLKAGWPPRLLAGAAACWRAPRFFGNRELQPSARRWTPLPAAPLPAAPLPDASRASRGSSRIEAPSPASGCRLSRTTRRVAGGSEVHAPRSLGLCRGVPAGTAKPSICAARPGAGRTYSQPTGSSGRVSDVFRGERSMSLDLGREEDL